MPRAPWLLTPAAAAAKLHICFVLALLAAAARAATSVSLVDVAGDDVVTRIALQRLYESTGGPQWLTVPGGQVAWGSPTSYCRWAGVSCCISSPLTRLPCNDSRAVVVLDLAGLGLQGQLPSDVPVLPELTVLNLQDNPGLAGPVPTVWTPPTLLWLSAKNTSLVACTDAGPTPTLPASTCVLPDALQLLSSSNDPAAAIQCPAVQLRSFQQHASSLAAATLKVITAPYVQPVVPGTVIADASFTLGHLCVCSSTGQLPVPVAAGALQLQCDPSISSSTPSNNTRWTIIVTLVSILPHVLIALGVLVWFKHRAYLKRLVWFKEAVLQRKRGKVPGTPGYVLHNGHGMVPLGDALVTWVCTDVACSTKLWEWDATVMDVAIDIHNRIMRQLLDELGGHEIRNEGDSFVLSFHEALDGIHFCLKAQERLQSASWPAPLLQHSSAGSVTVGDVLKESSLAGTGAVIIAGLRVRMGINTGMPDDIFLHDMTERVDYRGPEYDLTAEICDMACGGQILVGPKTYQSWMRTSADMGPDLWGHLTMMSDTNTNWSKEEGGRAPSRSLSLRQSLLSNTSLRVLLPGEGALAAAAASPTEGQHTATALTSRLSGEGWQRGGSQIMAGQQGAGFALPNRTCSQPAMQVLHGLPASSSCRNSPRSHLQGLDLQHPLRTSSGRMAPHHNPHHLNSHLPSHLQPHLLPELAPTHSFDSSVNGADMLPALEVQGSGSYSQAGSKKEDWAPAIITKALPVKLRQKSLLALVSGLMPQRSREQLAVGAGSQGGNSSQPNTPRSPMARGMGLTRMSIQATGSCVHTTGPPSHDGRHLDITGACGGASGSGAGDFEDGPHLSTQELTHAVLRNGGLQHRSRRTCASWLWCRCSGSVADNMPWENELHNLSSSSKKKRKALDKVESMVLDMGYYAWERGPAGRTESAQEAEHLQHPAQSGVLGMPPTQVVVHLVQLLPLAVAPRALLFTWPLPAQEQWEKLSPGFFDAPGSGSAMLPGMREVLNTSAHTPQRPVVTLTFSSIEGIKEVAAYDLQLAQYVTALHNACVRETLSVCHGYECKESEGAFMSAFTGPCAAVEWALTLQLALLHIAWPDELLAYHEWAREVWDSHNNQLLFRGLRAKVGIYTGSVDRVVPHCKTGRADYYGQTVNRAARLMTAAHGGQVVCDVGLKELLLREWATQNITAQQTGAGNLTTSSSVPLPAAGRPQIKEQSHSVSTGQGGHTLKSALSFQHSRQDITGPPRSVTWQVKDLQEPSDPATATFTAASAIPASGDAPVLTVVIADAAAATTLKGSGDTTTAAPCELAASGAACEQAGPASMWFNRTEGQALYSPAASSTPAQTPGSEPHQPVSGLLGGTRIARSYAGSFSRPRVRATSSQISRNGSTASLAVIVRDQQASRTAGDDSSTVGSSAQHLAGPASAYLSGDVSLTNLRPYGQVQSGTAGLQGKPPPPSNQASQAGHGDSMLPGRQIGHTDSMLLYGPTTTAPVAARQKKFSRLSSMDLNQVEVQPAAWDPTKHSRTSSSTRRPSAASGRSVTIFGAPSPRSNVTSLAASPQTQGVSRSVRPPTGAGASSVPPWLLSSTEVTPRSGASATCSMPDLTHALAAHGSVTSQHMSGASAHYNSPWDMSPPAAPRAPYLHDAARHRRSSLQPAGPLPPPQMRHSPSESDACWLMTGNASLGEHSGQVSRLSSMVPGPGVMAAYPTSIFSTAEVQDSMSFQSSEGTQRGQHESGCRRGSVPHTLNSARGSVQEGSYLDAPTLSASSENTRVGLPTHHVDVVPPQQQDVKAEHISVLVQPSLDAEQPGEDDSGYMRLSNTGICGHNADFMLNSNSRNNSAVLPKIMASAISPHSALQSPAKGAAADTGLSPGHNEHRSSIERGSSTSGGRSMRALLRSIDLGSIGQQQALNQRSQPRTSNPRPSLNLRIMHRASTGIPTATPKNTSDEHMPANSTVLAQCFKISISPQQDDGTSPSAPVPPGRTSQPGGITLIKYTRAQPSGEPEEDLARLDEEEGMQPLAAAKPVPMVPVEVGIWSLGSYRLKGVTELIRVVQLLPTCLDKRMEQLDKAGLAKGKARCIQRNVVHTEKLTLMLPDVSKLSCCSWNASSPQHSITLPEIPGSLPSAPHLMTAAGSISASRPGVSEGPHSAGPSIIGAMVAAPRSPTGVLNVHQLLQLDHSKLNNVPDAETHYLFPGDDTLAPIKELSSSLVSGTAQQSGSQDYPLPASSASGNRLQGAIGSAWFSSGSSMAAAGRLQQRRPNSLLLPASTNPQLAATGVLGSNGHPAILPMGSVHAPATTPSSYNASLPSGTLTHLEFRTSSSDQQASGPLQGSRHASSSFGLSFPLGLPADVTPPMVQQHEAALAYFTTVRAASCSSSAEQPSVQKLAAEFLLGSVPDSSSHTLATSMSVNALEKSLVHIGCPADPGTAGAPSIQGSSTGANKGPFMLQPSVASSASRLPQEAAQHRQDSPASLRPTGRFMAITQQAVGTSPALIDNVTSWPSRGATSTLPASQTLTDISQRVSTIVVGDAGNVSTRASSASGQWPEGHEEHVRLAATALLQAVAVNTPAPARVTFRTQQDTHPQQSQRVQLTQGRGSGQLLMPADRHHMVEQWARQTVHAPAPLDQSSLGSDAGAQLPVMLKSASLALSSAAITDSQQGQVGAIGRHRDASMIGASIAAADSNLTSPDGSNSAVPAPEKPMMDLVYHPSFKFGIGESPHLQELLASLQTSAPSSPAVEVTAQHLAGCEGVVDGRTVAEGQGDAVSFDLAGGSSPQHR